MFGVAEFAAKLGISVDQAKWKSAQKKLDTMNSSFKDMKLKVAGVTGAFLYLENKLGNFAGTLSNNAQILQTSTQNIQALQLAAKQAFVPVDSVMNAVGGLQQALANFRTGQGLPENLQMGLAMLSRASGEVINPANIKTGYELFQKIAQSISKVQSTQLKEGILTKLFGSPQLLPLIGNGLDKINSAYAQMRKNNAFLNDKQIQQAKEFGIQMAIVGETFKKAAMTAGISLLPALKELNKDFLAIAQNQDFIKFLSNTAIALGEIALVLAKVIGLLGHFLGVVGGNFGIGLYNMMHPDADSAKQASDDFVKYYQNQNNNSSNVTNKTNSSSTVNNHTSNTTIINHHGMSTVTAHVTGNMR